MAFDETKISFDWDNKLMLFLKSGGGGGWGLVHGFMVYMWYLSVCLCFEMFSFIICHVVFFIFSSFLKFEEDHPRPNSSWWNQRQVVHHNDLLIYIYTYWHVSMRNRSSSWYRVYLKIWVFPNLSALQNMIWPSEKVVFKRQPSLLPTERMSNFRLYMFIWHLGVVACRPT